MLALLPMSAQGHSRRFDRPPITSGLPAHNGLKSEIEPCPFCARGGSRGILRVRRAMDHQLLDKRKPDPERRTAVIPIFCRYEPIVRLDDGARDGQPHAHAFGLAGEKRLEDLF
jgi:hypothetical protein